MALTYDNLVGNQDQWASYITNIDMRDTPFTEWLPVGDKPVNSRYRYQADKYTAPRLNSHVDGKDWTGFNSASDGRDSLSSLVQWFDNTTSVSKLSEDVTNINGVASELSRDIPKRMKEMGRDMEVQFLSDSDCREDNKVTGYLTRGVGSWINASAQTLYPVPANFRPGLDYNGVALTVSNINTGSVSTAVTENDFRNLLQAVATLSGSSENIDAFLGIGAKRLFSDFQLYVPTVNVGNTAPTGSTQATYNVSWPDKAIVRTVNMYQGDQGQVNLIPSLWNGTMNSSQSITENGLVQLFRSYFLHRSKWELRWNQKPKVYRPEFKGGSYSGAMDAILMLVCKNPKAEAKWAPTA